jgi:hypothetical protein
VSRWQRAVSTASHAFGAIDGSWVRRIPALKDSLRIDELVNAIDR